MKEIDWVPYIERRNSLLYVSIFQEAYNSIMKNACGFGFSKQMCLFDGETYQFFLSKKEIEKCNDFLFNLPRERLEYIKARMILLESIEDDFLNERDFSDLNWVFNRTKEIFCYLTTFPISFLEVKRDVNFFINFRKRSRNLFQINFLPKLAKIGSYRKGYTKNDMLFLRWHEFKDKISKFEINKRKKSCILYFIDGKRGVTTNSKLIEWAKGLRKIEDKNQIEGTIANKGYVKGKVCVLNTINDLKKYNGEEIIVSVNTTPYLMPALAKAKAIVTDEGGLSCHAAIISRELGIPAVIGTKFATKIFKDGDIIEVDANKGIIKKCN